MNIREKCCYSILHISILFLVTGCMIIIPIIDIELPLADDRLTFDVTLLITDDFRRGNFGKYKENPFWLSLGSNMTHNSKRLIMNSFTNVTILEEKEGSNNSFSTSYILKPELEYIESTQGVSRWSIVKTTIGVKWVLLGKSGNLLWVKVIKGTGAAAVSEGELFRTEMALQDLFQKTQNEILSSKLLRKLE